MIFVHEYTHGTARFYIVSSEGLLWGTESAQNLTPEKLVLKA